MRCSGLLTSGVSRAVLGPAAESFLDYQLDNTLGRVQLGRQALGEVSSLAGIWVPGCAYEYSLWHSSGGRFRSPVFMSLGSGLRARFWYS